MPSVIDVLLDRAFSVYLGRHLVRITPSTVSRIPILMYHSVSNSVGGQHPYYETNTSPEVFIRHMQFLSDRGYSVITLDNALQLFSSGMNTSKCVVITFDDGYRDFYLTAYPVLKRLDFVATVFLATGLIADRRLQWNDAELMTWSEVRELSSLGIRFGSHTVNHLELTKLNKRRLDWEIRESKQTLEDKLGAVVRSFAYPYAFPWQNCAFARQLVDKLEASGYSNGVSTIVGRARSVDEPFSLPRLPVNTWDDLGLFQAKLEGGYDWLRLPQSIYKAVGYRTASGSSRQHKSG